MTLTRLVLAWLPVALWFLVAPPIGHRVDLLVDKQYFVWAYSRWAVIGRLLEAVVVTLLASLWFDSLGRGGWWLVFLLMGLLVAYAVRWQYFAAAAEQRRRELLIGLLDTGRYVLAGAILAWRLG